MVDRERVLAKLDEMRGYVTELRSIAPHSLDDYRRTATKRACERLLQIAVESVIDVCQLLVSGLRLGLPADEADLLDKLEEATVFTEKTDRRSLSNARVESRIAKVNKYRRPMPKLRTISMAVTMPGIPGNSAGATAS